MDLDRLRGTADLGMRLDRRRRLWLVLAASNREPAAVSETEFRALVILVGAIAGVGAFGLYWLLLTGGLPL
jgi:hypothetical protein